MKKIAVFSIIVFSLMIVSFMISGIFFFNSGLFNFNDGDVPEKNWLALAIQVESFQNDKFSHDSGLLLDAVRYEQQCISDVDCGWFYSQCGECRQIALNNKYLNEYLVAYEMACKDYVGSMCDMDLRNVSCVDDRCVLT